MYMKHSPALAYVNQCSIVLFLVTLMAPAEAIFCYLQVALPQNLPCARQCVFPTFAKSFRTIKLPRPDKSVAMQQQYAAYSTGLDAILFVLITVRN